MTERNWNYDVTLTKAEGQQCYETEELVKKFVQLEREGYSGLSLGLIIDIIDRQVPQMELPEPEK